MAKSAKKKKARKNAKPHVYRMPKTAAELNIVCAVCGQAAQWFDPERAKQAHLSGFICGNEQRSPRSEKLLIKASEPESVA